MYLRFVRLSVREGEEARFARFYRERVIAELEATPGCRFAGLLRPWRGSEHRSLTIWDTPEAAAAYEKSGLYHRLLRESEPMLEATTRWQVKLGDDPLETMDPARKEIPPDGYVVEDESASRVGADEEKVFVRIVSLHVDPAKRDEFESIYRQEVVPAVEAMEGCKGMVLAAGSRHSNELLSVSFWECEQDALRYEMSGEFERLSRRLEATFSPTYTWKMTLGGSSGEGAERTPKLDVSSYHLVQARRIGGEGGEGE